MPIYCNLIAHNAEVFVDCKRFLYWHISFLVDNKFAVFPNQSIGISFDTKWTSLLSGVIGKNFTLQKILLT